MIITDDSFLAEILAHPFDDAPRLIYAEWLEDRAHESGGGERCDECRFYGRGASCPTCLGSGRIPDPRAARAEFIRAQCRIDQLTQGSDEEIRLQSHLTEMMLTHGDCCYGEIPPDRWAWSASYIDRGFVASISCTLAAFMQHAADIFSRHPVTEVRLTDREPRASRLYHGTYRWYTDDIPIELYTQLIGIYPTGSNQPYWSSIAAARLALSRACVDLGRSLVVPPLPVIEWPKVEQAEVEHNPMLPNPSVPIPYGVIRFNESTGRVLE